MRYVHDISLLYMTNLTYKILIKKFKLGSHDIVFFSLNMKSLKGPQLPQLDDTHHEYV